MEQQLQQINIVRQAYHSNSYVGNHVNIALKYNSATPMSQEQLSTLEQDIKRLFGYYHETFPDESFPLKFHMLEHHVVEFIRHWRFPLGFFGEQGGESIHHELQALHRTHSQTKPATNRLKAIIQDHYVIVAPANRNVIPKKIRRNLESIDKQ
ncbi:uncharacterized protein LOC125570210 [Nematostella vectensis]|uniref:uncharacterized protein LOC125570210 n=1 Tax=Nematostella vectensis TaxID=45351 RepID=UPI002076E92B|nr:uncharacterized protein LOC125570210 [Nematostella vectensis]